MARSAAARWWGDGRASGNLKRRLAPGPCSKSGDRRSQAALSKSPAISPRDGVYTPAAQVELG